MIASKSQHFTDHTFLFSSAGIRRIRLVAQREGKSLEQTFRHLASRLANDPNPVFSTPSGENLNYTRSISVRTHALLGLRAIAADMGLPASTIGELVSVYCVREEREERPRSSIPATCYLLNPQ